METHKHLEPSFSNGFKDVYKYITEKSEFKVSKKGKNLDLSSLDNISANLEKEYNSFIEDPHLSRIDELKSVERSVMHESSAVTPENRTAFVYNKPAIDKQTILNSETSIK